MTGENRFNAVALLLLTFTFPVVETDSEGVTAFVIVISPEPEPKFSEVPVIAAAAVVMEPVPLAVTVTAPPVMALFRATLPLAPELKLTKEDAAKAVPVERALFVATVKDVNVVPEDETVRVPAVVFDTLTVPAVPTVSEGVASPNAPEAPTMSPLVDDSDTLVVPVILLPIEVLMAPLALVFRKTVAP